MEPVETSVRIKWVVQTKALEVKQIGNEWYVHFEGSRESIGFGTAKPFNQGDEVRITFEKVHHAPSSEKQRPSDADGKGTNKR